MGSGVSSTDTDNTVEANTTTKGKAGRNGRKLGRFSALIAAASFKNVRKRFGEKLYNVAITLSFL